MARDGRLTFKIRPLEHMYRMDYPSLHGPPSAADWPSMNVDVQKHSIRRRCGYEADRTLKATAIPYVTTKFTNRDGTIETLVLTGTDLLKRETASSKTFSYLTQSYVTGTISSITGTTVEGSGVDWVTAAIAADDEFIMTDDYVSDVEHDANWIPVASVTDSDTLELDSNYTYSGTAYRIRQLYSLPSGERWNYATVDYKFCFVNGNTNAQYYGGSGTAADLTTGDYAKKARYCIEYANRLVVADVEIASTREPWTVQYSKNGDPTDWTDSTAGSFDLLESQDIIKGFARIGGNLIIFKDDSFHIAHRTGVSTVPIAIPVHKKGVGCYASWSIVHVEGTAMWLARDDFYMMNGDHPEPIGEYIWDKFNAIVSDEAKKDVFGFWNPTKNHVLWVADTIEGQLVFVFDYKHKEWTTYRYWDDISCLGEG